jgi:hypothetical protein
MKKNFNKEMKENMKKHITFKQFREITDEQQEYLYNKCCPKPSVGDLKFYNFVCDFKLMKKNNKIKETRIEEKIDIDFMTQLLGKKAYDIMLDINVCEDNICDTLWGKVKELILKEVK